MSESVFFEDVAIGDRLDFGPLTISRDEINRNDMLVQNPGY